MFAFTRSKSIKSIQYLTHQSRHARREDETSKPRVRSDASPGASLSWSIDDSPRPDYSASFRALKKLRNAGERKGAQIGIHILVGVSPEWIKETGDLHDPQNPRNRQLLDAAMTWANGWSDDGCYAARLDLDETGGAVVDLFVAPTAEQAHKSGKSKRVVSVNKALEVLAIARTGKKGKHFSALNTDWAEYAKDTLDHRLERGRPKAETGAEHVGPDQYRTMMGQAQAARDAAVEAEKRAIATERAAAAKLAEAASAVRIAAEVGAAVIAGTMVRDHAGKWSTRPGGPDPEVLRPVWRIIRPAIDSVGDWWQRVRGRVEAMPDPEAVRQELADVEIDPFSAPAQQPREEATGPGL